jgi:hypothetical protein
MYEKEIEQGRLIVGLIGAGIFIIVTLWAYFSFASPYMHVWHQSMLGQAELSRAESNRQIAILEANAKKESAKSLSDAEVIRAKGVAEANTIIGSSLQGNEGYLRYLYITNISDNHDKTVVYIPTEAGLPILETQRMK